MGNKFARMADHAMIVKLKPHLAQLLRDLAARGYMDPNAIKDLGNGRYDVQLPKDAIMDAISSEFIATGLLEDDEPNARGLLLEELLDRVNAILE